MKSKIGKLVRYIYWTIKKRKLKIIIQSNCNISINSNIEGVNVIGKNSILYNTTLGRFSYIGKNANIVNAKVGRYCSIGDNLSILAATHPTEKFVSTHPMFYSISKQNGTTYVNENKFKEIIYIDENNAISVEIGSDVWIGNNVSIRGGIKIGHGAIIGANSLVLKNIEPYSIYGGIPARKIGSRFTEEQQRFLLKSKWWEWPEENIKNNVDKFSNIEAFIKELEGR